MKHITPDDAGIQRTGTIFLPEEIPLPDRVLAFGVKGDCMSGDHITSRDLVIVDPERAPRHGDIGVFMIRNEDGGFDKVLKRLDLSQGTRLVPSNPAHAPIVITDEDDLFAVGTVLAVVSPVE
jgi:SOS-response transcriptional repressor LexA